VEKVEVKITDEERARQERIAARPPLSEILNLHDFEVCLCHVDTRIYLRTLQAIAKYTMPEKAWAYYSSAADDEITNRENHAAFHRYI
jgi:L-lactate dehydrogenase (cytochrome)